MKISLDPDQHLYGFQPWIYMSRESQGQRKHMNILYHG